MNGLQRVRFTFHLNRVRCIHQRSMDERRKVHAICIVECFLQIFLVFFALYDLKINMRRKNAIIVTNSIAQL